MVCRRCEGKGKLTIRLGRPDPDRDTHTRYEGVYCLYPARTCGVCHGTGVERDKPPPRPYLGAIKIRDPNDIGQWF